MANPWMASLRREPFSRFPEHGSTAIGLNLRLECRFACSPWTRRTRIQSRSCAVPWLCLPSALCRMLSVAINFSAHLRRLSLPRTGLSQLIKEGLRSVRLPRSATNRTVSTKRFRVKAREVGGAEPRGPEPKGADLTRQQTLTLLD